ncbi:MAG TPA: glycosyltransferase family 4 protein [Candidatus Binatia bacterium]|nr:glycosyltransferase family 4 protein [Candidatus Binatia bacterium]
MAKPRPLSIIMIGQKGLPVRADSGGIERHVEELASRLVARGNRVTAYVRPRHTTARLTEYKGIRLQRMPSIPTRSLDALTHSFLATVSALFKKADVIHYHGVGPATLAWLPRLFKPKSRVVVTFHSIDRLHQKWGAVARAYLRFGEWAAVTYPHATIAVSKTIQDYCRKEFGKKVDHIPNGADIPAYPGKDLLAQWGLEPGSYILTVARLVQQKGIHHLIAAYDGFEKEKKLVVVGAGSFGSEYAERVRKMAEGNSSIVFTGFQSGRALAQLYANAYLYVHPSEAEGLAIAVLEAMAAGRCVLVSDIPENVESIDHSGLTFVNADPEDLRAKLRELLNHPEVVEQLGGKAREWIRLTYDWDVIAERTEAVYRREVGK